MLVRFRKVKRLAPNHSSSENLSLDLNPALNHQAVLCPSGCHWVGDSGSLLCILLPLRIFSEVGVQSFYNQEEGWTENSDDVEPDRVV